MIVSTPPGTAQLTAGRGPVKETEYSVLRPGRWQDVLSPGQSGLHCVDGV